LRFLLASLVLLLLLPAPQAADAKGLEPFRVETPTGKVGWVRGMPAKLWWHDYFSAGSKTKRGCPCTSPEATAQYTQRIARNWKRWPQPWLLVPTTGASMLYYPPTRSTPGYVLAPAVLGTDKRRWDDWETASQRMATILRNAIPSTKQP
jgi:hypothetical protein